MMLINHWQIGDQYTVRHPFVLAGLYSIGLGETGRRRREGTEGEAS
jgi:hypothetical protein